MLKSFVISTEVQRNGEIFELNNTDFSTTVEMTICGRIAL